MKNQEPLLPPGFRFHPTDEELILHYLKNRATSAPCPASIIAEVDIYKFNPWDLPEKAMFGDREWYFFTPRDRKYPNGVRPNRAAASGYWKATGTDKPIVTSSGRSESIGVKKALVFYTGKPPKGVKTNWIMHEYRLADSSSKFQHMQIKQKDLSMRLDDWVLCRIYKKTNNQHAGSPVAEREESSLEDSYFSGFSNAAQQSSYKLPRIASLTELGEDADYSLLSRLLSDNPFDMASSSELSSLLGHPTTPIPNQPAAYNLHSGHLNENNGSSGISMSYPRLPQVESSAGSVVGSSNTKRQRAPEMCHEENGFVLHHNPSKKYCANSSSSYSNVTNSSCTLATFSDQLDNPQYNSISQSYFTNQLLLNSHLGGLQY